MFKLNRNVVGDESLPLIGGNNKKHVPYSDYNAISCKNEKYPVAVIYVLVTKFFEAFAANGIRTILALYLRDDLGLSENFSTIMLHIFNFFGQFCPIFGAILADSYIGNIKTISYFYIMYGIGWYGLILTSFPFVGIPILFLVSLSLLFIAIGNGSIRACITSLGAIQFKIPEQCHSLAYYFTLYYFFYYLGVFLSKIIPPLVRVKTSCFNKGCYPAVFGTLGSAFMVSWIVFIIGKIYYKDENISNENVIFQFFGCIKNAIVTKIKDKNITKSYWLQYSIGRYSKDFVKDVSIVLKIFKLFSPLPIYFALLVQQDSSWTFQASQLNTTFIGIKIEPDQAKAIGPIFLFSIIPIWQYIGAPMLKYFNKEIHPLQSMIMGGFFAGLAFILSGILQVFIQNSMWKSISITWQAPQFFFLMLGELFLSIPGLRFAFTQAPDSMKSVVTAAWFINNAFGNLIVVLITKFHPMNSQAYEYFLYSILMFISIGIFSIFSIDYIRDLKRLQGADYSKEDTSDTSNISMIP